MVYLLKLDLRRKELGMSRNALARLSKVSLPTVTRVLTGKETSPTLATVEAIATALGLELHLREVVDADKMREEQAKSRASRIVGIVQGTMGLESQGVDKKAVKRLQKRSAQRLLSGSGRRLWNE